MKSETEIQRAILKYLNSLPDHSFDKKQASPYGNTNGFSDIVGVVNGRAVYIEVKAGTKPTPNQLNFLRKKQSCGALAGIAKSIPDALEICSGGFGAECGEWRTDDGKT